MLRQLLTYHLLAILLVSRIGIPVYSHVCHNMDESWTSLYLPANACCSWTFQQNGHGCCKAAAQPDDVTLEAQPCCENRTDLLALNSGFVLLSQSLTKAQHHTGDALIVPMADKAVDMDVQQSFSLTKSHGPPMALFGRSLLIAEQVFRC